MYIDKVLYIDYDVYVMNKAGGEKVNMLVYLAVAFVYLVGIIGIVVMKKIQPDDWIYPAWVVIVCILFTLFVGWYVS